MTSDEIILASRLLTVAAARFHEDSCTDADPQLFQGIDVNARELLTSEFNKWNSGDSDLVPFECIPIDGWMEYLAAALGEEVA